MAKKLNVDAEVEHVLNNMKSMDVTSEGYSAATKNLQGLCQARSFKTSSWIEPETILTAATNLLGIILILNHEKLNVITTKAFSLLVKGRF